MKQHPRIASCSTERMNIQEFLQSLSERLSASASAQTVYAEPVTMGNRTVIPAACFRYAFAGGGGSGSDGSGGGAGGRLHARPYGAIEVTPEGTRLITFADRARIAAGLV